MAEARVRALRAVELAVTDTVSTARFFADVWRLTPVGTGNGITYLRATGAHHWVTSIRKADTTALVRLVFDAADHSTLGSLQAQVKAAGAEQVQPIKRLETPGGGWGFGFRDLEGRNIAVVAEVADHEDAGLAPDRPSKVSHVNLQCPDPARDFAFYRDGLGFRLTEQSRPMYFLRCNSDHSSIVLSKHARPTLNHIAYEVPSWEDVMRGAGRMRQHGYKLGWGPGRHGPGHSVFAYFVAHEQLPLEYTSEQVKVDDDNHIPMPIDHWGWPEGRLDHWGLMPGPSPEFVALKDKFHFTADGHLL